MIVYLFMIALIDILEIVLGPIQLVNGAFTNILANTGLINLIRFSTFIFDPIFITLIIDTFIFWFGAFTLRPLINFIRNKG